MLISLLLSQPILSKIQYPHTLLRLDNHTNRALKRSIECFQDSILSTVLAALTTSFIPKNHLILTVVYLISQISNSISTHTITFPPEPGSKDLFRNY